MRPTRRLRSWQDMGQSPPSSPSATPGRKKDGATLHKEGAILHKEGAVLHKEGATLHKEGATLHKEGATLHKDGRYPPQGRALPSTRTGATLHKKDAPRESRGIHN
jgi:hypothetical protein